MADIQMAAVPVGRTSGNDVGHEGLELLNAPAGKTTPPFPAREAAPPGGRPPVVDRTLTTVANLAKLLPTGTVLAFQSLNTTFSNRETCNAVNRCLTVALISCCALSCAFFSFTDTLLGASGKAYAGVATYRGFYLFNRQPCDEEERELPAEDLRELRIRWVDYVHALFSMLVFLALALSDSNVQSCLFESAGRRDSSKYLRDLPLAAGFLASFVFLVFPTCRRGVGYSDMAPQPVRASRGGGRVASAGVNASATPSSALEDGPSSKEHPAMSLV